MGNDGKEGGVAFHEAEHLEITRLHLAVLQAFQRGWSYLCRTLNSHPASLASSCNACGVGKKLE